MPIQRDSSGLFYALQGGPTYQAVSCCQVNLDRLIAGLVKRALVQVLMGSENALFEAYRAFIKVAAKIKHFHLGRELFINRLRTRAFWSETAALFRESHFYHPFCLCSCRKPPRATFFRACPSQSVSQNETDSRMQPVSWPDGIAVPVSLARCAWSNAGQCRLSERPSQHAAISQVRNGCMTLPFMQLFSWTLPPAVVRLRLA